MVELTVALAREMLGAAGLEDADPAKALADGSAMDVWRRMIAAQGGDPDAALPLARERHVVTAPSSGVLTRLDAYAVGVAAWRLGAGRARKEDPVQAGAGVELHAKPGDAVTAGAPLLTLHTDTPERFAYALEAWRAPGTSPRRAPASHRARSSSTASPDGPRGLPARPVPRPVPRPGRDRGRSGAGAPARSGRRARPRPSDEFRARRGSRPV